MRKVKNEGRQLGMAQETGHVSVRIRKDMYDAFDGDCI